MCRESIDFVLGYNQNCYRALQLTEAGIYFYWYFPVIVFQYTNKCEFQYTNKCYVYCNRNIIIVSTINVSYISRQQMTRNINWKECTSNK